MSNRPKKLRGGILLGGLLQQVFGRRVCFFGGYVWDCNGVGAEYFQKCSPLFKKWGRDLCVALTVTATGCSAGQAVGKSGSS